MPEDNQPDLIDQPYRDEKPASVVEAQRPRRSPAVGAGYPTQDNLDAKRAWQAHIDAGRLGKS